MRRAIIFIAVLLLIACAPENRNSSDEILSIADELGNVETDSSIDEILVQDNITEESYGAETKKEEFSGKELAKNYYEFSKHDYELAQDKIILLYFYADWCPICEAEQEQTFAAFNEIDNENIVGFRVNYRDSETDDDEVAIAKDFGISYQHTKVILKNGKRVLKAPDSWDRARYIEELSKVS